MNFRIVQSQGQLSQYVKHYWVMESEGSESPVAERVIPTENIQLIFHYRNPFRVIRQKIYPSDVQPQSLISGLTNTYSDVSTFGETGMIAVTLYPEAACRFFRFPLSEIADQSVSLSDIFYSEVRTLEDQLANDQNLEERIGRIESFLLSRLQPLPDYDAGLLTACMGVIRSNHGQITANNLAGNLAVTPRSLERKFAQYLGKSPKQFIQTIRFQKVLDDFSGAPEENLTSFAYRNGYFDQSHFIRDFRRFTGYTPREYRTLYCTAEKMA